MMYTSEDKKRPKYEGVGDSLFGNDFRSTWRRDYARLLHSPSFRRLQGKTQLFPSFESDFFRNRLTHSLEVAQIAKSIAASINHKFIQHDEDKIDLDLVEIAGLAHDLGHPPFGHQGEEALDHCMSSHGGFEGNAQTLRILARLEKKSYEVSAELGGFDGSGLDKRAGLNLSFRTLASILKYDAVIPSSREPDEKGNVKLAKGYYELESDLVRRIKVNVTGDSSWTGEFKTIECQIMDIADDIAYSTYDLEDTFKAGFINPFDLLFANESFYKSVADNINKNFEYPVKTQTVRDTLSNTFISLFKLEIEPEGLQGVSDMKEVYIASQYAYRNAQRIAKDSHFRTEFTSALINEAVNAIDFNFDRKIPALSTVKLNGQARLKVEVLKKVAFESQVLSPKLKVAEYRGKEIVKKIYESLTQDRGYELLPDDYRMLYEINKKNGDTAQKRVICDYIACMTDQYAIEFYGRLTSENPATIFKPY